MTFVFVLFISVIFNEYLTNGGACQDTKNQTVCDARKECFWHPGLDQCECSSEAPLDMIFAIDKSASISPADFYYQLDFLVSLSRQPNINLERVRLIVIQYINSIYRPYSIQGIIYKSFNMVNIIDYNFKRISCFQC